jgi:hypothetical protein
MRPRNIYEKLNNLLMENYEIRQPQNQSLVESILTLYYFLLTDREQESADHFIKEQSFSHVYTLMIHEFSKYDQIDDMINLNNARAGNKHQSLVIKICHELFYILLPEDAEKEVNKQQSQHMIAYETKKNHVFEMIIRLIDPQSNLFGRSSPQARKNILTMLRHQLEFQYGEEKAHFI